MFRRKTEQAEEAGQAAQMAAAGLLQEQAEHTVAVAAVQIKQAEWEMAPLAQSALFGAQAAPFLQLTRETCDVHSN